MSDAVYKRYDIKEELLDGQIVALASATINHYRTVNNIIRIFERLLEGKPCDVFGEGIDVYLTEKDIVIPDGMIVCNKNIIKNRGVMGNPDLIFEVLSPGTAKRDRGYKKSLYEKCGINEYWIVDINNLAIEVYLLQESKYVLENVYAIYPDYMLERASDKSSLPHLIKLLNSNDMLIAVNEVFAGLMRDN